MALSITQSNSILEISGIVLPYSACALIEKEQVQKTSLGAIKITQKILKSYIWVNRNSETFNYLHQSKIFFKNFLTKKLLCLALVFRIEKWK
jgi:hypothetical protein